MIIICVIMDFICIVFFFGIKLGNFIVVGVIVLIKWDEDIFGFVGNFFVLIKKGIWIS